MIQKEGTLHVDDKEMKAMVIYTIENIFQETVISQRNEIVHFLMSDKSFYDFIQYLRDKDVDISNLGHLKTWYDVEEQFPSRSIFDSNISIEVRLKLKNGVTNTHTAYYHYEKKGWVGLTPCLTHISRKDVTHWTHIF